ncbi:HD-GYP domain-containing protein [Hippea alviniae]|uniref:HD-GYP domain-containing protein n=1 Tax=Hippea alviniae TaxID=1279027 RepID=UPI0003B69875|nr:HD domain-containing phosphohydrolase [Hippea alviniae]
MSIQKIIDSLSKKHAHVVGDILKTDKLLEEDDLKRFVEGLCTIGAKKILCIEDNRVIFSGDEKFIGKDISIDEFEGLSEIDKYKIAKSLFGDPELRKFKVYRISKNSGFVVVFDMNVPEYQVALVDLLMNSRKWHTRFENSGFARLRVAIGFVYKLDKETYMHSYRTKEYSAYIARKYGIDKKTLLDIKIGAILHDIGKLFVPFNILKKEERLTDDEFEIIKQHPLYSYRILKAFGFDDCVLDIALFHHEKIDGSGYPYGLRDIPLCVQIVAVSDILDAVQSSRSYKDKMGCNVILEEMKKFEGKFDDRLMKMVFDFIESDAFFAFKNKFNKVSSRYFSNSELDNCSNIFERLNVLRSENTDLKKEVELYKDVAAKVQRKYEETIELCEGRKKYKNTKLEATVDTIFRLASVVGNLKTIVVVENEGVRYLKGEPLNFDILNDIAKGYKRLNIEGVDLKDNRKVYLVFDSEIRLSPSLRFTIEGLF